MNNNENRDQEELEKDNNSSKEPQASKPETDGMPANNTADTSESNAYDTGSRQYTQNGQYNPNDQRNGYGYYGSFGNYNAGYQQNGANYGNNGYGYGYQRDTRTPSQKYSDVFNKERPLSESGEDASIKGTPTSKKILKSLLALTLCLVFGFLGAAFGIYALSQTSLVDENSMLSKWIIDSSGIFINKVVVERDPLEYTGGYTECAEKIVKTVVEITELEKSDDTYTEVGHASGVIISEDGYIVTNQHVTEGVDALKVVLYDGTVYYAYADQNGIIGDDSITDVALIKITPEAALPYATLGESAGLKYAQQVYAVGNPLGIGTSVTIGYISCPEREVITSGIKHNLIQMDAAVSPGNSGGGLFDTYGNLIGIVNSKTSGTGVEGIGYAIPVDTVLEVVDDLAIYGYVKDRAALGVTVASIYSKDTYEYYKARDLSEYLYDYRYGLYVLSSTNESADIKTGDRLTHFNGEFISSSATLTEYLLKCKPGDEATLTLDRLVRAKDGGYSFETKEIKVTLFERTW